jgi:tetratricopeptide (TPR) repeat protein
MSKGAGSMGKRFCARIHFICVIFSAVLVSSLCADDAFNKLINDKKFDEALKYADEKIPAASRDAATWCQIARANEALSLPEKALACFMVSWRMNPKNYDALLGAAKIYNKLDQPDNALSYASKALEQSFTPEASWEYARACIKLNRGAEAKKALEKVIESTPDNAIANRELGVIYYNDKQFDKAIPLLKKSYAAQADPNVVFMLGKAFLETSAIDSAIVYLKETTVKNPAQNEAGLLLARAYFKREKYLAAATEYEKIAGRPELTAGDQFNRAISHEKAGNVDAAMKAYQAAAAKFGGSKEPDAMTSHIKSGTGLLEKKDFDAALTHFQFIVDADPEAKTVTNIYFLLADAYIGSGNQMKAISSLEKALSLDSKNIEAYARLADLYEKNNLPDKARQIYEKMMSLSPNDPHVYQVLGDYNLKAKKYADALKHFEKCYVLDHTAKSAEGIALASSALGQWDKARDAAETAVKVDPNLINSRIVLAKSCMRDKNFKTAREHLEIIVAKRPSELEFLKQLAICYVNLNEQQRLAEIDKKISDADKSNVDSRLRLAQYALAQKDVKQAFDLFKELAQLSPQNPLIFKNLYDITLQSGDKNNAAMYAKKYLALNPSDAPGQKSLGDLLYELKDLDGALAAYRAALKLDPAIKGFYKRYAELVIAKGQQDEVIKVLSNAINSGEADASSYTTLGMIYQKKGNYAKALEMNQKAIQLDPQNFDVLAALAECQAKTGDVNGAIISYEQVIMMNPKIDEEYKELGNLYASQNRTDQAIGVYRKYLEKIPSDQDIAKKVGMSLYGKKQYQDAIKYMEMVKGYGDNNFQLALGDCYFNLNNLKKAEQVYEGIRAKYKNSASFNIKPVMKLLAEAYEKDNNMPLAVDVYTAYALLPGQKDPDASFKAASMQEKINPLRAKKIYEDNVQAFPNDYRNFLRLGIIMAKDKATLSKSASLLQKASSIADTIPTMWLELAQVYNKLGNEQEELNAYKKLVTMEPQNFEANKRLGVILMKKNVVTDAMVYLEMANTLSQKDPEILTLLAAGYIKTNRLKDATDVLQKAKALKSDNPELRMQLIDLYKKTGQDKKALEELKQLVEMKRGDNKILIMYAQGLDNDGKYKEAEEMIENIKSTDPENIEALMILGDVQGKQKKLDAAVETYKEISYINPNYAPALYQRAEMHMAQNKSQWAKAFYERALRADPKYALAELGLAKVGKIQKSQSLYMEHLEKAIKLDPNNEEIKEEYQKAKK